MDDVRFCEGRPVDVWFKYQGLGSLLTDTTPQLAVYLNAHQTTTVCTFCTNDH